MQIIQLYNWIALNSLINIEDATYSNCFHLNWLWQLIGCVNYQRHQKLDAPVKYFLFSIFFAKNEQNMLYHVNIFLLIILRIVWG